MGCEKGKGGLVVTAMRSSMERRRVSNAKVTSLRQRKYQELTMQIEQENLQRARKILERRKSERDRLNAYMHSVGEHPHAKQNNPEHFSRGMRRPHTEGMFGRPPWTASLRTDYETLIKLREKEIAVATLRIKNNQKQQQAPNKTKGINHYTNGKGGESYLMNNKDFDELEPEFGHHERFDTNHHKSNNNGSAGVRNPNLKVLGNELFANISTELLMLEPTVFREHSFQGLRTGARALLPPPVSTSNTPKAAFITTPSLKSCLKSNTHHNQKSPDTPRAFPIQEPSEGYMMPCGGASQSRAVTATPKIGLHGPQSLVKAMTTHSTVKTMRDPFLDHPEMFPWGGDHEDNMNYGEELSKECNHPQPANNDSSTTPEQELFSKPTESETLSSEVKVLPDPATILRPTSGRHIESEIPEMLSCSGVEKQSDNNNAPNACSSPPSDYIVQQIITTTQSTLAARYTSTTESWQEDRKILSPLVPPPEGKHHEDNKTSECEGESFISSLDSEAATTRLIAEVIAVQSRLEDCKLKPLDFRNMFADRGRACRTELLAPAKVDDEDQELVSSQKEQGIIEVTMRNHEIFIHEDTSQDDTGAVPIWENITAENVSNTVTASSVDDHEKEVLPTLHCIQDRIDNFAEMHVFQEMEPSKKLLQQGAAWEIPWKNERRRPVESIAADPGCPAVKNQQITNSPFPCTITKPPKPVGTTAPVENNHSEKIKQQPKGLNLIDQQQQQAYTRYVSDLKQIPGETNAQSEGVNSTNSQVDMQGVENNNTEVGSDCSLTSTKRTSKYLNIGYRDLSEAPRPKYTKQHCFYSSHGLLPVGYSQPRECPKRVKQNNLPPQNIRHGGQQPCCGGFHDSLGDKENYGSDDQELSILASLEKLDWKLAAISARAMNRTSITPSMVSQNQTSVQSAPAATGVKGASTDGTTPRKFPVHPLRPSSVRIQKPPTRNFRHRRIVGVTNKIHQDIYN